jgi:ABC-2 type transport system ATP-binding protein
VELKSDNRTILLTTHYIEEAERLCDRVAIIDNGTIIELGTPREIQERTLGNAIVEIVTNEPAPLDRLPDLLKREKLVAKPGGRALTVQTFEPAKTIVEAVKWIDALGLELVDIHLKRPTLEDVFIELTGRRLREQ